MAASKENNPDAAVGKDTRPPDPDNTMATPPGDVAMKTAYPLHFGPMHTMTIDPALDSHEIGQLRIRLVELGIVEPEDWDKAAAATPGGNVEAILRCIQDNGSKQRQRTARTGPTLTDFQIEHILAGHPEKLRFDHYLILDQLGEGGMGTVLRALNTNLNRIEALKTVLLSMGEGTHDASHARERFEREARVLASLDHPCITRIYHAGRVNATSFIAMEFVRGKSLKERVDATNRKGNSVPVWIACQYMIQIADALQHAHEHNVIHRDVKPSNVMISDSGELKVLDLGIARLFRPPTSPNTIPGSTRLTQNATGLGTPEVMSPEQWADATNVTPAADMYSLGCTFFYTLTGRMPFASDTVQGLMFCHVNDPAPKVAELMPRTIPKRIDAILARMLAKFPDERFASCNDLIKELAPLTTREAIEAALSEQQRRRKNPQLPWLFGSLAAVCIAAGAWFTPDLVRNYRANRLPKDAPAVNGGRQSSEERKSPPPAPDPKVAARAAIEKWSGEFQRATPSVWKSTDELLKAIGPVASADEAKRVAEQLTSAKRLTHAEGLLASIEAAAAGLSPSLDEMKKSLRDTLQKSDALFADVRFGPALAKFLARQWMDKAESLAARTLRENPEAWPDEAALRKAIPNEVSDQGGYAKLVEFLRVETKRRQQETPERFLASFQKEHAAVWPDLGELRRLAPLPKEPSESIDPARLAAYKLQIETLTSQMRSPFAHFDRSKLPVGEWVVKHALLPVMMQWVAEGREAEPADNIDFDARMVQGDKVVNQVRVGARTALQVRGKQPGFVAAFDWDETTGELQVAAFVGPLGTDEWQKVQELTNRQTSRDLLVLFWTPKSPLDEANLQGWQKLSAGKSKTERYTPEDLALLKSAFARPEVLDRLIERMRTGKYGGAFAPGAERVTFARKSLQFEVRN